SGMGRSPSCARSVASQPPSATSTRTQRQRLLVHQVRVSRVLRRDRSGPPSLQGRRRAVAAAPHPGNARGPLVAGGGQAVCRDVHGRREGAAGGMRTDMRPSIAELEDRIAALPPEARAAAERIFAVSSTVGRLDPPAEMRDWITKQFGSVDAVMAPRIVRVTHLVLHERALFT